MTPEHRVQRLKNLLEEMKAKGYKTYASIERDYEVNASYLSQLINGTRSFGESAARKMEVCLGLPEFYFEQTEQAELDVNHEIDSLLANAKSPITIDNEDNNRIPIPFYDITFCCGEGNSIEIDFVELTKTLGFEPSFFADRRLKPDNCKMFQATGDSMEYYICDGDTVMIDVSSIEPLENEVFAIYFEGERMIRRFEKRQNGVIALVADNPKYKEKLVTDPEYSGFRIVGRVVYRCG